MYPRETVWSEELMVAGRSAVIAMVSGASIEIAISRPMGSLSNKKVLIYDEAGFARVCAALLERSGYTADIMGAQSGYPVGPDVGVFVTRYRYGAFMLEEITKRNIPSIVLFDNIDERFVTMVHEYENLYGMLKPLDYDKFRDLVGGLLADGCISREDYSII